MFHVRPRQGGAFGRQFRERLGEAFALLTVDEAEELELFGPAPLTRAARARIGNRVAIPLRSDVLLYEPDQLADMRGFHGELSADEMRIPLIAC